MMEILLKDITFKPYVRMTQRSKWVDKDAIEYLRSRATLKDMMRKYMRQHKLEMMPARVPLSVYLFFYVPSNPGHKCDLDNQIKAILDAGNEILYPDDRWIDKIDAERLMGPRNEIVMCVNRMIPLPR